MMCGEKKNELDTKAKILDVAARLFAEKGFEATSVRDIATKAGVNLSAINYHFKSKDRLYWSVSLRAHERLETGIAQIARQTVSTFDLAWGIFEFLQRESKALKNAFVIMISDSGPPIEKEVLEALKEKKEFGPPGGIFLYDAIVRELAPQQVADDSIHWMVKAVFSYIFHWSLMLGSNYCRQLFPDQPDFSPANQKEFLRHLVDACLGHLRQLSESK